MIGPARFKKLLNTVLSRMLKTEEVIFNRNKRNLIAVFVIVNLVRQI